MFEAALGACVRIDESGQTIDTDPLVTTITFNLGRSYESRGLADQAIDVYERLLRRHDDYTDARTRLAYIKLRRHPTGEGPAAVTKLHHDNPADLEARALYGWFLGRLQAKKRPTNAQEEDEFRHHKRTLQNFDKHDRYALVAMGNMLLAQAREMRRDSDSDRTKRSATYSRAVEFFEKALSLDPRNAYAAQGIAIALVEDRKDTSAALPIFVKIRDTLKDAHVYVNLGHIFTEGRQFSKAIESYQTALSKEGKTNDPQILQCLGRAYLNKGRAENDLEAYAKALECAEMVSSHDVVLFWGTCRLDVCDADGRLGTCFGARAGALPLQRRLCANPAGVGPAQGAREPAVLGATRTGICRPRGCHQDARRDCAAPASTVPQARH
jgi:RNA polymerase-associated protein CTR9